MTPPLRSNLISASDLHALLETNDPVLRIFDTRFDLTDPRAGREAYAEGHVPGALYLHLDDDLSSPVRTHGGRHPLPDMEVFVAKLGRLGVGPESRVVAYDASGGLFAGRLWWLLRYAGFDRVQLLDGGLGAWTEAGYGVTTEVPRFPAATLELALRAEMAVDRDHVLRNLGNPDVLLIDARAPERYRGETEPLDPKAGHIPSAVNLPFAGNLEGGRFRDPAALAERFAVTEEAEEVVLYCGSGVSAAHDVLAMEEAGLPTPRLYVGSWSDWSSYDDAPVATGDLGTLDETAG